MVATSMNINMNQISSSLPRFGLGMAALGRPGYINLNRASVFDNSNINPNSNSNNTSNTSTNTSTNTSEVQQVRSVERMQTQANDVIHTLFAKNNEKTQSQSKFQEMSMLNLPWLDCARSYGLSEKFVGDYLKDNEIHPDQVYVSSKWGYEYVADWNVQLEDGKPHEVKDHSVENFLKQIDETISHIGEYVNLYQVHSATFESGILTDSKVHEALGECKKSKKWSIGLSVSGPTQDEILREAMKIQLADGSRLFDSVQCTYNILEQRPFDALVEAHNAGMDVIIKEGMANGRVFLHEKIQDAARSSSGGDSYSIDQIALACILSQPFNGRVLSGAVTSEQLESNMKALELADKMKASGSEEALLLNDIMMTCQIDSETYWKDRSSLMWN